MSNIKAAVKTAQPAQELETVSILDIQKEFGFTDLRFVSHQATGNTYLHLVNGDQYISVKVGGKAIMEGSDELEKMRSLINSNKIYTGVNDGNIWFTFAPAASLKPTVTVKFSDLMKAGKLVNAAGGVPVV